MITTALRRWPVPALRAKTPVIDDYRVTGQGAKSTEPRWSILRNVLKWRE